MQINIKIKIIILYFSKKFNCFLKIFVKKFCADFLHIAQIEYIGALREVRERIDPKVI